MARLVLSEEGELIDEYPINTDKFFIGRTEKNNIQIDSMAVSGQHAKIVMILDDAFLEDLGSTNGTFLNGERISSCPIENGDVISIGTHNIKYLSEFDKNIPNSQISSKTPINGDAPHLEALDTDGEKIFLTMKLTTLGQPGEHVAAISQRKDGFFFSHVDGGDTNAVTLLNGKPIPAEGIQLKDADIIEVAGTKMKFIQNPIPIS